MNNFDVFITNNRLGGSITANVERLHGNEGNGGPVPPDNKQKHFNFKSDDHLIIRIKCVNHDITNKDYIQINKTNSPISISIRNNFWRLRFEPKQPGLPSTNVEIGTRDDDKDEKKQSKQK
jgi:hypothetical protein